MQERWHRTTDANGSNGGRMQIQRRVALTIVWQSLILLLVACAPSAVTPRPGMADRVDSSPSSAIPNMATPGDAPAAATPSAAIATARVTVPVQLASPPVSTCLIGASPRIGATAPMPPDLTLGVVMTILADGRVLALGADSGAAGRAAIYNPGADRWTPTGPMGEARFAPDAVPLPDGRVLVVGGMTLASGASTVVETFDPSTLSFAPVAPLTDVLPSDRVRAVSLPGGIVLALTSRWARRYDATANTWTATGPKQTDAARDAERLRDGRILVLNADAPNVAGGPVAPGTHGSPGTGVAPAASVRPLAEIYDPGTDRWTVATPMSTPRVAAYSTTVLEDGRVLVIGGELGGTGELYDPVHDHWVPIAAMPGQRGFHAVAALPGGDALVVGGQVNGGTARSRVPDDLPRSMYRYDVARDTWYPWGELAVARWSPQIVALRADRLLVAGGSLETPSAELLSICK